MDEWVDIWTSEGSPTGEKVLKSEAHRKGLFHPTVHLWIGNSKQELLLQQRALQKKTFPGKWDVSVAGHISAGDQPLATAVRECEEELGITIDTADLDLIAILRSEIKHSETLTDREFHHIYFTKLDLPLTAFTLQKEEVAQVKWFPISQFKVMQEQPEQHKEMIPFEKDYLLELYRYISLKE
ncbi:NUDIX hydrolase [Robertkochia sediminum]|uniref:NUDIX hydrolase n=1 Tax=Robertkochia sediminum TaxID=2785326 RepID=UPI001931BEA2|nr:NUDIX domain-containing protein [Robertkochia sediminum]MBL7473071.1 NUDIX domain-containing protein [Robertkochia sediminum]